MDEVVPPQRGLADHRGTPRQQAREQHVRLEDRQRIWDAVCRAVIIPLGVLVDRNHDLYHYLWRSVVDVDSVTQFADRLVAAGFEDVAHRTATGWQQGILHTFVARKPRENP